MLKLKFSYIVYIILKLLEETLQLQDAFWLKMATFFNEQTYVLSLW